MKRYYYLTGIIVGLLLMESCSQPLISRVSRRSATANTRYVGGRPTIQMPMLADLNISDRIATGSYSGTGVKEEFAKSMAVANAVKLASADVLIEPMYDIKVEDANITVEVRGHAATYKNFRQVTPEPHQLKPGEINKSNTNKSIKKEVPKPIEKQEPIEEVKQPEKPAEVIEENPIPENKPKRKEGKLSTPAYLVVCTAMAKEGDAKSAAAKLEQQGYEASYLWIPDYEPEGKKLYRVFIGPFETREQALEMLPEVKNLNKVAYLLHLK